ncbi:hypothetical protein LSH36_32g17006 [Paralvinella palmiformis]|uniref:Uncharacterized protein n=1 Tax=Paralvinella palmiformis TaxID=53620 RepID=A0AAD9KAI9_9ANNE|nr:hypothetical protein LSH36_32g17006 [Paralvinella palmiformis]
MLGVQIHMGLEVKAYSLIDCIKKCANAGKGVQARAINLSLQICFGIDYDFSNHKCYFHVNNNVPPNQFCPANGLMPGVPRDAVANPTVVSILLCKYMYL